MNAVWKDVIGYEAILQVSNLGRVFSKRTNKVLKPTVNKKGYVTLSTRVGGKAVCFRVHRLVALVFIPNADGKLEVNHKDLNKQNNTVFNLEWATSKENTAHAIQNGVHVIPRKWKLSETDKTFIRENYKPRDTQFGCRSLARRFGVHHKVIQKVLAD